jgi:hypothetical protein
VVLIPISGEKLTEKLGRKIGNTWNWLRRRKDEQLPSIPSVNYQRFYRNEEYAQMGLVFLYMSVIFFFPTYVEPIITQWMNNSMAGLIISWMAVGFMCLIIFESKRGYDDRMKSKAFEYDFWEGKIREATESGIESYPFQLWIENIQRLNPNLHEYTELIGEDGEPIATESDITGLLGESDHLYLVTTAYRKPDDILKRFIVICDGNIAEHETLFTDTRAFLGVFGVNRRASEINFVVAKRMKDNSPILFITDSAVVVNKVLNREERLKCNLPHTLVAEMEAGIMAGERFMNLADNLAAELDESENRARNWELAYHRAKGEDIREDGIMQPETDPEPALFSDRQKKAITYFFIGIVLFGLAMLVAYYSGALIPWGLYP